MILSSIHSNLNKDVYGTITRFFVDGQPQHIIQRGNNKQAIFAGDQDYNLYLDCLYSASLKFDLHIHAYVLMSNHVHLLATPLHPNSISKSLQSIGRKYVQYFNHSYQRTGTLWEGRYKATLIDSEQYLLTCMRYIELNPVRAKMVNHPAQYPWSSYSTNANGTVNKLISPHELYLRLERNPLHRQTNYQQLFQSSITKIDLENIREATNKAWALGNNKFTQQVEQLAVVAQT